MINKDELLREMADDGLGAPPARAPRPRRSPATARSRARRRTRGARPRRAGGPGQVLDFLARRREPARRRSSAPSRARRRRRGLRARRRSRAELADLEEVGESARARARPRARGARAAGRAPETRSRRAASEPARLSPRRRLCVTSAASCSGGTARRPRRASSPFAGGAARPPRRLGRLIAAAMVLASSAGVACASTHDRRPRARAPGGDGRRGYGRRGCRGHERRVRARSDARRRRWRWRCDRARRRFPRRLLREQVLVPGITALVAHLPAERELHGDGGGRLVVSGFGALSECLGITCSAAARALA